MMSIEVKFNQLLAEHEQLKREHASLKAAVTVARLDAARHERELRMTNAGLASDAKDRLRKAFECSKDNAGLKEAINTEKKR
jgi:hypothetical protein